MLDSCHAEHGRPAPRRSRDAEGNARRGAPARRAAGGDHRGDAAPSLRPPRRDAARDQLRLGLEDVEQTAAADATAAEAESPAVRGAASARRRANRGALPAHLPRVETVCDLDDKSCPCCRGPLHQIEEDRSEWLDIVPAQFRVLVTRRPRYACRACEDVVVQKPAPARLIKGGLPTETAIANVNGFAKTCKASWPKGQTNQQRVQALLQWVGYKQAAATRFLSANPTLSLIVAAEFNIYTLFAAQCPRSGVHAARQRIPCSMPSLPPAGCLIVPGRATTAKGLQTERTSPHPERSSRSARTFSEIQIVSRDRGGGYGEAATKALPRALQVADRWQLFENASAAFLDAVRKSMRAIRAAIGATTISGLKPSSRLRQTQTLTPDWSAPLGPDREGLIV